MRAPRQSGLLHNTVVAGEAAVMPPQIYQLGNILGFQHLGSDGGIAAFRAIGAVAQYKLDADSGQDAENLVLDAAFRQDHIQLSFSGHVILLRHRGRKHKKKPAAAGFDLSSSNRTR